MEDALISYFGTDPGDLTADEMHGREPSPARCELRCVCGHDRHEHALDLALHFCEALGCECDRFVAPSVSSSAPPGERCVNCGLLDSQHPNAAKGCYVAWTSKCLPCEEWEWLNEQAKAKAIASSAEPAPPPNVYWLIEYRENGQTTAYLREWKHYGGDGGGWHYLPTTDSALARRFETRELALAVIDSEAFQWNVPNAKRFVVEDHRNCSGPTHAEIVIDTASLRAVAESQIASREQAIQDIEALPIETDADSFVDSNKTRSLISRDAVLSILS